MSKLSPSQKLYEELKKAGLDESIIMNLVGPLYQKEHEALFNTPQELFAGLSENEANRLVETPLEPDTVLQFNTLTTEQAMLSPLFRQMKRLIELIDNEGELKLTATEALPPKVVKELYPMGISNKWIDNGYQKLSREGDSECVQMAKLTLLTAGILKMRQKKLSITAKGKKLKNDDNALIQLLFTQSMIRFNWGYFDAFDLEYVGSFGFKYTLYLLAKYGNEEHEEGFYANLFMRSFPIILELLEMKYNLQDPDVKFYRCYNNRCFRRIFLYWGLVELDKIEILRNSFVKTTPFFNAFISVKH